MDVKNKIVVITGSAMGLGKAFAEKLLQEGAKVCLSDINEEIGMATLSELKGTYGESQVHFIKCNVTVKADLEALYDGCEKHFNGKVSIFCNNAGINQKAGWKKLMDINIIAVMEGTYMAMERMDVSKGGIGGLIVNTASLAGLVTMPYNDPKGLEAADANSYFASKHAVVGLTKSLANKEVLAHTGVKLQCICPSFADTNIIREGIKEEETDAVKKTFGLMSPEYVAEAFYSLITAGGNGDAIVVVKDAPPMLFPDINMFLVYALALGGKLFGVKVMKPLHQLLFAFVMLCLFYIFVSILINLIF